MHTLFSKLQAEAKEIVQYILYNKVNKSSVLLINSFPGKKLKKFCHGASLEATWCYLFTFTRNWHHLHSQQHKQHDEKNSKLQNSD